MPHHHPPADPAAINDPTQPPGFPTEPGTGMNLDPAIPTEGDGSITPPSADITPVSSQPGAFNPNNSSNNNNNPNNNPNNNNNNTPNNDVNPTFNTQPNRVANPVNPSPINPVNNNNPGQTNQANNNDLIHNFKTNITDDSPISRSQPTKPPNDPSKLTNGQQEQQPVTNDLTKLPNSLNQTNSVNNNTHSTANEETVNNNITTTQPQPQQQQPQPQQQQPNQQQQQQQQQLPNQPQQLPNQQQQPQIDPQSISHSSQSTSHRTQQNSTNPNNDTGTSVATIMGVLVAAVIGAIILAGILAMIKRRKKSHHQSDYHQDFFHEKALGYHNDSDRQSLDPPSTGLPTSPGTNRSLKPRSDPPYGPRPPSIIERHQASPAVPAPVPSYQPGQIFNYSHHPPPSQPFHLHRPKPPTYHSPYGNPSSDMAFANNPPMDPSPNSGPGQFNHNLHVHGMNHDQSQMSPPEQRGGINMTQNPIPYPPGTPGEQHPSYQTNNQPLLLNTASYNQQQVDQLDFFGHPSPAATMIGSTPADWNSGKPYEQPFNPEHNLLGSAVNVATGIALTDDQTGIKPSHPTDSNLQPSLLQYHDRGSYDRGYETNNLFGPIGVKDLCIPDLQQSYLDCRDRNSDLELKEKEDAYGGTGGGDGIEMDNLGTNNTTTGNIIYAKTKDQGLDWKLSSPKLSSPLGDFFVDRLSSPDHSLDKDSGTDHFLYNERPKHSLKVINH